MIEALRERTFAFPVCLNYKALANYSLTINTARANAPLIWTSGQLMLLSSFVQTSNKKHEAFKNTLIFYRKAKPSPVIAFFLAIIFFIKDFSLLGLFNTGDWLVIGKWLIKNFYKLNGLKKYLATHKNIYTFLIENTTRRYHEAPTHNPI
jgi:hypothetical protein